MVDSVGDEIWEVFVEKTGIVAACRCRRWGRSRVVRKDIMRRSGLSCFSSFLVSRLSCVLLAAPADGSRTNHKHTTGTPHTSLNISHNSDKLNNMSSAATNDATKAPEMVCTATILMYLGIVSDHFSAFLSLQKNNNPPTLTSCVFFCSLSKEGGSSAPEQNKRSPSDFLKAVLGRPVNVRLSSGTDYRGKLSMTFESRNPSLFLTLISV